MSLLLISLFWILNYWPASALRPDCIHIELSVQELFSLWEINCFSVGSLRCVLISCYLARHGLWNGEIQILSFIILRLFQCYVRVWKLRDHLAKTNKGPVDAAFISGSSFVHHFLIALLEILILYLLTLAKAFLLLTPST